MSIRKYKDGWQARVSVKVNGKYTLKTQATRTKAEAEDFERRIKMKEKSGSDFGAQDITVPEYMRKFIDLYKSGKSVRTQEIYEGSYKKIYGEFYGRKLVNINRSDIQDFMNRFGKHHAITTSKKLFQHLHQVFTNAIEDGIITRDPCAHIEVTGKDAQKADEKFLEYDDYQVLLQYVFDNADYPKLYQEYILFALQTGCRYSEISGVKVDDLNFKKNTISINKQWYERQNKLGPTKGDGASDRIIAVSKPYMDFLHCLLGEREKFLRMNFIKDDDGFLFLTKDGQHLKNDSANDGLDYLSKKLNIKRVTMHGMRHTHASLLIFRHRDPIYIAKRLGHQNVQQVFKTYGHLFSRMDAENDKFVTDDLGKDLTRSNNVIPLKDFDSPESK